MIPCDCEHKARPEDSAPRTQRHHGIARHQPVFSKCRRWSVELQTTAAFSRDLTHLLARATLCCIASEKYRNVELGNDIRLFASGVSERENFRGTPVFFLPSLG